MLKCPSMSPPRPPGRHRRALSAPGGPVTAEGDPRLRRLLGEALQQSTGAELEAAARELTHGFHSYPARFHPLLVRRLLADVPAGAVVLDPFVGSGTTAVEAMLRGARVRASDVNPLAIALTRLKATPWPFMQRMALRDAAHHHAARSLERVKARARTRESGERFDDPTRYAPHVFRELVGLREEIAHEEDDALRGALLLVLSSIVVKVSRQPGDTGRGTVERAIGKGLPTRMFQRKADELVERLKAFAERVPTGTPPPDVRLADARRLPHVADASVDVVVTSPPYVGTYDYVQQHERRWGWLGLDAGGFARAEIGARRAADLDGWQRDVDAFVAELARVLKPGAHAFLVSGDSAVGDVAVPGDEALRAAAAKAGLSVVASAQQARPSFYGRQATRREHLLLLARPS